MTQYNNRTHNNTLKDSEKIAKSLLDIDNTVSIGFIPIVPRTSFESNLEREEHSKFNEMINSRTNYLSNYVKYEDMPERIKEYIDVGLVSIDDIVTSGDGFYSITNPSLKEITEYYTGIELEQTEISDWSLYFILNSDGSASYSVHKSRKDGVAVSFIPFDDDFIEGLKSYDKEDEILYYYNNMLTGENDKTDNWFDRFFNKVRKFNFSCDKNLTTYFSNVNSRGSYVISDLHVENVLRNYLDENNNFSVPNYDKFPEETRYMLEEFDCYDKVTNTIHIDDVNNLSNQEFNALHFATSGNFSSYSFAAENKFHSDFSYLESGSVTNAGVGEEGKSAWFFAQMYLTPDIYNVISQYEEHN